MELAGWAADIAAPARLPAAIAVFADTEIVYVGRTNVDRGVDGGVPEAIRWRGFRFNVSDAFLRSERMPRVRLFAISADDRATELLYPQDYPWGD